LQEVQGGPATGCTALVADQNTLLNSSQYVFSSAPPSGQGECTGFTHSCNATRQPISPNLVWDDGGVEDNYPTAEIACQSWCPLHPTLCGGDGTATAQYANPPLNTIAYCINSNIQHVHTFSLASRCPGGYSLQGNTCIPDSTAPVLLACFNNKCAANSTLSGGQCECNANFLTANGTCSGGKNNGQGGKGLCTIGNPCNPANGNKFERQVIYQGVNGFELSLTFNSFDYSPTRFVRNWRDSFDRQVRMDGPNAIVYRPDGVALRFTASGSNWVTDADTVDRLVQIPGGWEFSVADGDQLETYDMAGNLASIRSRSGLTQTLDYSDGTGGTDKFVLDANGNPTTTPLPGGLLVRAKDHVGRALILGYGAKLRVIKVTDPASGIYRFAYDTDKNLVSITFPDTEVRAFLYNEGANTGGADLPHALTGIEVNGVRYATFHYDSQQRSTLTEHAGGANRYLLSYGVGSTDVTNALGAVRTYAFQSLFGAFKNSSITSAGGTAPCPECGPASQAFDTNGNVASRTDWRGNATNYAYDLTRNLEASRTEAVGSKQERTITTIWHPTFRLPIQIVEAGRTTGLEYDAKGTLTKRTITAAPGEVREWTYTPTYSTIDASFIVKLEENGPHTDLFDVLDKTTYDYYDVNDSVANNRGLLKRVTDALGHVTEITSYDAHGQPLSIIDPNGLVTALGYDARQRLISRNVGGESTGYEYWPNALLKKITLSDSSSLSYGYDDAQRLTDITDNLGNKIVYTLDAMGNRLQEEIKDPASVVVQKRTREYNSLNRLFREIGGTSPTTQITEYGYDDQGNLTSIDGPLANDTNTFTFDALNRLATMVDPAGAVGGTTTFIHNALDQVTSITDPRGLITSYTLDGLGNLKQQVSPDTGMTVSTYDAAGNLLTRTDAQSQQTTYVHDALNRATKITYAGDVVHDYFYDEGTNQKGLLTRITEPAGISTTYSYNQKGRLTSETRVISGVTYPTSYGYDSFGRLNRIGYPSGRQVNYVLDGGLGRIGSITTTKSGMTTSLVGSVAYHPFGGVKAFTLGNGQTYARGYDLDGRVSSYTLGSLTQALTYDAASRITQIQDQGGGPTRTFSYDVLDRLLSASTPTVNQTFTYDPNGNRATLNSAPYTYFANTNRLQTTGTVSFTYDANGSAITAGPHTLGYDTRGRLFQAQTPTGIAGYTVNALGQRIVKQFGGVTTVFHYDSAGRLIAETTAAGTVQREYVYLYDQLVKVLVTR
jgi:YD repeat-containing protein